MQHIPGYRDPWEMFVRLRVHFFGDLNKIVRLYVVKVVVWICQKGTFANHRNDRLKRHSAHVLQK